jgi:hypothetical protein
LLDTSCGKWYEQKEAQNLLFNIPSAIRSAPHGGDLPVPEPPKEYHLNSEMEEGDTEKTGSHEEEPTDPDSQGPASESPHKLT